MQNKDKDNLFFHTGNYKLMLYYYDVFICNIKNRFLMFKISRRK